MERSTRQRQAIRQILERAGRPMDPQQILAQAQAISPGLGVATVYRTLKGFLEEGIVHAVELPGHATSLYETAPRPHHHHFRCRTCDNVYEVPGCPKNLNILAPPGFLLEDHEVVLYGVCAACSSKKRPRRKRSE